MPWLPNKLRKIIDLRGVSDSAVSRATGISQPSISAYARGDKVPRQDKINKLCEFFNVDEYYFTQENSFIPREILPKGLPEEVQKFLLDESNVEYLVVSEKAKRDGIPADVFQKIYEIAKSLQKKD